jgi:hypothetical protein
MIDPNFIIGILVGLFLGTSMATVFLLIKFSRETRKIEFYAAHKEAINDFKKKAAVNFSENMAAIQKKEVKNNQGKPVRKYGKVPSIDKKLNDYNVNFEVKNDGYHYIIRHNGFTVDFWPTTKRWKCRDTDKLGSRFLELLNYVGVFMMRKNKWT